MRPHREAKEPQREMFEVDLELSLAKTTSGRKRTRFTDSYAGLQPILNSEGPIDDGII